MASTTEPTRIIIGSFEEKIQLIQNMVPMMRECKRISPENEHITRSLIEYLEEIKLYILYIKITNIIYKYQMKMYRLMLLLYITYSSSINTYSSGFKLYEFSKHPESYQPDGSIQDKFLFKNPVITFNKIYKRHTNFALEHNNKNPTFGQTFTFSPLSYCDDEYNIKIAKECFKDNPRKWWCIYDACISPSRPKPYYINITLPPIKEN